MASVWSCELEERNKKETKKWYLLSLPIQKQPWQLQEKTATLSERLWWKQVNHMERYLCSIWRAVSDERLVSLSTCLRVRCALWTVLVSHSSWKQGTGNFWVESLLSFLSTAFQRKCGHLRGESGKFWVLAQIVGQKGISHCHNAGLTKQAKGIFPYTWYFLNTVSFFRDIMQVEIYLPLLQERRTQWKATFQVWFFFPLVTSFLSYDRPLVLPHTGK